jgi:hypothetical protein
MGFKGCFSDVHRELSKLLSNVYTQLDGRYRLFGGQSAVASRIKSRCHRISCGKHERNKGGDFQFSPNYFMQNVQRSSSYENSYDQSNTRVCMILYLIVVEKITEIVLKIGGGAGIFIK